MATTLNRLAAKSLVSLPAGKHHDGGGLYLEVRGASRAFLFRYTLDGRARWMGLGPFPDISLARARELAAEARGLVAERKDPIEARAASRQAQQRAARSVGDAAEAYVAARAPSWRPRMLAAVKGLVLLYDRPAGEAGPLADLPIASVGSEAVAAWLTPIWHATPARGAKVRGLLEQIIAHAEAAGWRDEARANPAAWSRLKAVLPPARKVRPVVHHRALDASDMPALWQALEGRTGAAVEALRLIMLTAVRHSEATLAVWSEFTLDGDEPIWTVPAARMKAGRPHRVPLSPQAVEVLRRLQAVRRGPLVFPGQSGRKPIANTTISALLKRMGGDWHSKVTPHGARATLRSWCASVGVPAEVAEMLLAHAQPSLTQAYQRDTLDRQRREVLCRWADHVAGPVGG
ncbi:tyrosine-type recombinase/integrase [Roseomonas sp. PWR1]|uniref:Tyrosine-type recombinase/integrase n=1 Tax=Roseomonas nitratireducens TaxID=2820810 RepID=A0ABS4AQQ4_9PROT|nr:site-specific integrase [Neoroseomonas nitratireducens]MBP0463597.1 tyrosine-type recombinase/integrase [Neoroseomonas nitratireducens]